MGKFINVLVGVTLLQKAGAELSPSLLEHKSPIQGLSDSRFLSLKVPAADVYVAPVRILAQPEPKMIGAFALQQHDSPPLAEGPRPSPFSKSIQMLFGAVALGFQMVFARLESKRVTQEAAESLTGKADANPNSWKYWLVNDTLFLATSVLVAGVGYGSGLQIGFLAGTTLIYFTCRRHGVEKPTSSVEKIAPCSALLGWTAFAVLKFTHLGNLFEKSQVDTFISLWPAINNIIAGATFVEECLTAKPKSVTKDSISFRKEALSKLVPWYLGTTATVFGLLGVESLSVAAIASQALTVTNNFFLTALIAYRLKAENPRRTLREILGGRSNP